MLGKTFHQTHANQTQRIPGIEVSDASRNTLSESMSAAESRSDAGMAYLDGSSGHRGRLWNALSGQ